jgi:hypothetical protein
MNFLQQNDIPSTREELYQHPRYSHRRTLSKVVKGYKYAVSCSYSNPYSSGLCNWIHMEEEDTDIFVFVTGNIVQDLEDEKYLFELSIKKYMQFEAYAATVETASGNVLYDYMRNLYVLQDKWKYEKNTDMYTVNDEIYSDTAELTYYDVDEYYKLDKFIKCIDLCTWRLV